MKQLSFAPGDAGSLWVPVREVPVLSRNVTINILNNGYMLIYLQLIYLQGVVLGDRGHIVFPVDRTIHYTWLVIKYTLIKYTLTQVDIS